MICNRVDNLQQMLHVDSGIEILVFVEGSDKILNPRKSFFFKGLDDRGPYFGAFGDALDNIPVKVIKPESVGDLLGDKTAAASRLHANGDNRNASLQLACLPDRTAFPLPDLLLYKLCD